MTRTCPVCGSTAVKHQEGEYVFVWPKGFATPQSTFPNATWEVCDDCGEESLPSELSDRIEAEQYRIQGLLTPPEIRAIRERTGLSQVEMARLLSVGDKTFARWEAGLSIQNRSMDNLIRVASAHPDLFAEFEARREPDRDRAVEHYIRSLPALKAQNEYALATHGELPPVGEIGKIRKRLQALVEERKDRRKETVADEAEA